MPLDFPPSPTNGQVYANWIYSTSKAAWQAKPLESDVAVPSPTPPSTPNNGDLWFNSDDGNLYVYYNDGDTSQWVQVKSDATLSSTLGNRVTALELPGRIVQVVSATLTTATSASSSAFVWTDVTGLTLSITPTKTSSKIFVTYNLPVSASGTCFVGARIVRNSTGIGVNTSSSTMNASSITYITDNGRLETLSGSFLDSPATTSATTYKMQYTQNATFTLYANRRAAATDLGGAATITAFEVAG